MITRLQVDLNAAAVGSRVDSVHPNKRRQTGYVRILKNDVRQLLLALGHGCERNGFRCLRDTQNHPGVLHREETLGYDDIEEERQNQGAECDEQGRSLVTEYPLQSSAVIMDDPLIEVFRGLVNASRRFAGLRLQQLG